MDPLAQWLHALGRPAVWAHRGASAAAPENSLAALRLAAELGADGVEFDVQACATGELVVFHDATLARCCGVMGAVGETPLTRLRELSLDRWANARNLPQMGERIPLLSEWLAAVPTELFVNLEVKCDVLAAASIARECASALVDSGLRERSLVSSFHPAALWVAGLARAEIARGVLVENSAHWRALLLLGCSARPAAVHVPHRLATAERVRRWHRLGYAVATWTVDERDDAMRCLDAGVDVLISNRPDVMRPLVERYRRPASGVAGTACEMSA